MEIKGSAPDDRGFIAEIIAKVLRADKCFIYEDDMETLEHLEEVSKCKIFLGHNSIGISSQDNQVPSAI